MRMRSAQSSRVVLPWQCHGDREKAARFTLKGNHLNAIRSNRILRIGDLAFQAGIGVQTLHYYERWGLLSKTARFLSNHRIYPLTRTRADELFGPEFALTQDEAVTDSLPLFSGKERWQIWKNREENTKL